MHTTKIQTKTRWSIDTIHSELGFRVKHLMFSYLRGNFKEFDVAIYTYGNDFMNATIDCWLNPASINTGDRQRDDQLKGVDFLDAKNFKVITFAADHFVEGKKEHSYQMYGDLIMKGITRPIKLQVAFGGIITDPWNNEKALINITGKINRKNWGIDWNMTLKTGGFLVSEEVWINCEVQLIRQG